MKIFQTDNALAKLLNDLDIIIKTYVKSGDIEKMLWQYRQSVMNTLIIYHDYKKEKKQFEESLK